MSGLSLIQLVYDIDPQLLGFFLKRHRVSLLVYDRVKLYTLSPGLSTTKIPQDKFRRNAGENHLPKGRV